MRSKYVTDPVQVARLAVQLEDENWAFRTWLKGGYGYDDERLMGVVSELTAHVSAQIDCTTCANCCRKLDVDVDCEDVLRLAGVLDMSTPELQAAYLKGSDEPGEKSWRLAAPCPFLECNLCTVYAARPDNCRAYPNLGADFVSHSIRRIESTFVCPIVFNVVEGMKDVLGWRHTN
jgi:Fe-S-cluster containining protein